MKCDFCCTAINFERCSAYHRVQDCNCISLGVINPWHTCAGGLRYLSCMCVYLSVTNLPATWVAFLPFRRYGVLIAIDN